MKEIAEKVAKLIPVAQLRATTENVEIYEDAIARLEGRLKNCPGIKETDGMKKHPCVFHYFYGSNDIYICEYDGEDSMFGYAIIGGDLFNSEWGYFSLDELTSDQYMNIDYYFYEDSIEAALYEKYPKYFKKPESL